MTYYKCGKCGGKIIRRSDGIDYECAQCKTIYKVNKKYSLVFSVFLFNVLIIACAVDSYIINNTINKPTSFWISILIMTFIIGSLTFLFELFVNRYIVRKFIEK